MSLNKQTQAWIMLLLATLMVVTRSHHFSSVTHLPDASLAVFFLAGMYISRTLSFAFLMLLAVVTDYVAVTYAGVSSFCITAAYGFLLPAYGVMWFAGKWFARHYTASWKALPWLVSSLALGTLVSQMFSSGGFYYFSGYFASPTVAGFGMQLLQYTPQALNGVLFWMVIASLVHLLVLTRRRNATHA